MSTIDLTAPSADAIAALTALREQHNVLILGPPATGKSRLLAELKYWFRKTIEAGPGFLPSGPVAFPTVQVEGIEEWLPSPDRDKREVWEITFHQGTKHRDFVCGIAPRVQGQGPAFTTVRGPVFRAAGHAAQPNGAALVIIDEINRGPAVAIFGDLITAMESDKRLLPDGSTGPQTRTFKVIGDDGEPGEIALPHHVYLVASMNEADTSVEPLDVAFLRRWAPFRLRPREDLLRAYLGVPNALPLQPNATDRERVFDVAVRAWNRINGRISLARGSEFQIGHGVFMHEEPGSLPVDLAGALSFVSKVWSRMYAHVAEVFFGDTRGVAATLSADQPGSPYHLIERFFADSPVWQLDGPVELSGDAVYPVMLAIAQTD